MTDRAIVIERAFQLAHSGLSIEDIKRQLKAEGHWECDLQLGSREVIRCLREARLRGRHNRRVASVDKPSPTGSRLPQLEFNVDEIDLWNVARFLVERRGEHAVAHATAQADKMLEAGNGIGRTTWLRIAGTCAALLGKKSSSNRPAN